MAGPDVEVKPLPFDEAIAAFRRRAANLVPTDRWTEMWQEEHAAAFTVARSAGYDILGDISGELDKALANGETFESFAKNLTPILQSKGWWGKSVEDNGEVVQLGSLSRLATIYDTNLRVSFAAGQWERVERTKSALPYLVYEGILDSRIRPAHRAWTGTVKPVGDAWWDKHYPPCGFRCRCWVRQLTTLGMQKAGGVTEHPPTGPARSYTNSSTGETQTLPWGVDPGFGYNPGKAAYEGQIGPNAAKVMADKMAATPPAVAALPLPKPILADQATEFANWFDGIDRNRLIGDLRVAGALSEAVLGYLDALGLQPQSGAITITDQALGHMRRVVKSAVVPDDATLRALPALLAAPEAILWDRDMKNLVYVVAIEGQSGTRFVVSLDRSVKTRDADSGQRARIVTNAIINGQMVDVQSLRDRRKYDVIEGKV